MRSPVSLTLSHRFTPNSQRTKDPAAKQGTRLKLREGRIAQKWSLTRSFRSIRRTAIAAVVFLVCIAGTVVGIQASADAHAKPKPIPLQSFRVLPGNGNRVHAPHGDLGEPVPPLLFHPRRLGAQSPLQSGGNVCELKVLSDQPDLEKRPPVVLRHNFSHRADIPGQGQERVREVFYLETGQPSDLYLPTWKSLTGPPDETPNQPPALQHFTCYPVTFAPQQGQTKSKLTIPTAGHRGSHGRVRLLPCGRAL